MAVRAPQVLWWSDDEIWRDDLILSGSTDLGKPHFDPSAPLEDQTKTANENGKQVTKVIKEGYQGNLKV